MAHHSAFHGTGAQPLEPGISVVVPAYNSEASLPELVSRLEAVLTQSTPRYELIFVDDGSRDRTWRLIEELAQTNTWVSGINLMRNYGQHNALLCGIRLARYDVTVTIDDDLQHPPEELPRLLQRLRDGSDVVYGAPECEPQGVWRNLASQVTKIVLQSAMGAESARHVSAFRAFRTQLRDAFAEAQGPFIAFDVLLTWATNRFAWVRVRHDPRRFGRSNYTPRQLVVHAVTLMTGFSTLPLQLASLVGFACTAFGIAVLAYVLARYFVGGQLPGFSFLASAIAIFSGAQLFALGIFGEYLARVHARTMDRPAYAIRTRTGPASAPEAQQPAA